MLMHTAVVQPMQRGFLRESFVLQNLACPSCLQCRLS